MRSLSALFLRSRRPRGSWVATRICSPGCGERSASNRPKDELRQLPQSWHVFHDLADDRRNWDHVAIGSGGVFLIETKAYSQPAVVKGDMLRSGRLTTSGAGMRHSAVRLKEALQRESGFAVYVQAVFPVWGRSRPGRCRGESSRLPRGDAATRVVGGPAETTQRRRGRSPRRRGREDRCIRVMRGGGTARRRYTL